MSEFEKRGNFVQNAIFLSLSTSHHFKPVRALGFKLAVWAFYYTDQALEARASLLSRAVSRRRERTIKWRFSNVMDGCACPIHPESGHGS